MYADDLLKVLVVCHHLRKKRSFNNTHHRRFFLVVGLKADRDREQSKRQEVLKMGQNRQPNTVWKLSLGSLFFKCSEDEAAFLPQAPQQDTMMQYLRYIL